MTSYNYFNNKSKDFETLAFSFLWVGNHIGEAAGGMSVKERMSALNACDEILTSQSSDKNASDKELFVSTLMVVGGDNAQSLVDAYNADPRSTEQGLKDTVRILTEYAESGQSGAVEQSTFFLNALVKMAQAVIDESEVSPADMKARSKAFDFIKNLAIPNVNNTNTKSETKLEIKQKKKNENNSAKSKTPKSSQVANAEAPGCSAFLTITGILILAIVVLLVGLWLRRETISPPDNNQQPVNIQKSSDSSDSANSNDNTDPVTPALYAEQYESAKPQDIQPASNDMQESQDSERITAELELAKAKKDLLLAERALMEERRLAAASNSNYVPQNKTTKNDYIPCEYTASTPLVCESRQDQPAMCSWSYSSCGSPRLQKKLSKSSCSNRVTLDVPNNQIIVTAGCRAQFVPEI